MSSHVTPRLDAAGIFCCLAAGHAPDICPQSRPRVAFADFFLFSSFATYIGYTGTLQGWWDSLDFLDADRVAEQRARQAAEDALVMKDPALKEKVGLGEEEDEMDDIFTDFMKEQEQEVCMLLWFLRSTDMKAQTGIQ